MINEKHALTWKNNFGQNFFFFFKIGFQNFGQI
jgi:hypothetical protein